MNRPEIVTKSLMWFVVLLLVCLTAGCGGKGLSSGNIAPEVAKAITAFSLAGVAGTINETAKTIAVPMPYGTNVTALIATYTTTGAGVKVGATTQVSAATANDFTSPVAYIVTAADNSTATYNVTVTVAPNSAKAITAFSLAGVAGTIKETAKTIAVPMPYGTNVTALVATYTATGAGVKVGATTQVSAATANDFTSPVAYIVTAADNSTATYNVTVTVALAAPVPLGLAGNYVIFANTGIDTSAGSSVITGDMGAGPGITSTSITGFALNLPAASAFSTSAQVSGNVYAFDYAPPTPANVTTASNDMGTAYTDAASRTATSAATTNVGNGTLTGLTLTPGVYQWGTAVNITTDLTLNGSATDVWIFKVAGILDLVAAKSVLLTGGALPKNIFWQVAGAVNIGAAAHMEGVILSQTAITLGAGASANSRLLAQTTVTLESNAVTQPAP
ncbi:MAG: ice-binding family protein [Gallionellaceae bacterium]|nr:ice-binding family protein [Gallionellaceae bacterium]